LKCSPKVLRGVRGSDAPRLPNIIKNKYSIQSKRETEKSTPESEVNSNEFLFDEFPLYMIEIPI